MTAAAQKRHKHIEQKKMTALAVIFFAAWSSALQGERSGGAAALKRQAGTQRLGLRQHTIHFLEGQALLVAVLRSAAWEIFSVILIGPPSFLL